MLESTWILNLPSSYLRTCMQAGFKDLPQVVGQTAMLTQNDPLYHNITTIATGVSNFSNRLNIEKFAGMSSLRSQIWPADRAWKGDCGAAGMEIVAEANTPRGVDGTMFHPNLEVNKSLTVFDDDLLRKFTLDFSHSGKFGKLDAFKYTLSNSTFEPSANFRANCAYGNDAPAGTFNVSMLKNAPVAISKPFFLDADSSYRANIDGLGLPNREKHEMHFWIEPRLGIPLQEMKRVQINMHVYPQKMWKATQGLKNGGFYSPLCWTEESVTVPRHIENEVTAMVQVSDALVLVIRYGGFAVGGAVVLLTAYSMLGGRFKLQNENANVGRSFGVNDEGRDDDDDAAQQQRKVGHSQGTTAEAQRLLGTGPLV